jgi:predicted enzyme related to lactoylglutathione lyase
MTPHTHEYEFSAIPPSTVALRVADVAAAKAKLEEAGLEVGEMWDSGLCRGAGVNDPAGNRILLHCRCAPSLDGFMP